MSVWLYLSALLLFVYLSVLSHRLNGPHPKARPRTSPSVKELEAVSYESIDMLDAIPRERTGHRYIVIGGSGFLGRIVVRLLLMRGETNVRILDVDSPPPEMLSQTPATFIKADITSLPSVRAGLLLPFPDGTHASVIFHVAAVIRNFERASYLWPLSKRINVDGVANVLQVARELPPNSVTFIYTSTIGVALPPPKFMKLGWDYASRPYDKTIVSDDDPPLDPSTFTMCYTRSKLAAERLVKGANGQNGMKVGIIRPGFAIVGLGDRVITGSLNLPVCPVWDKNWSATNISVWDTAAAHLCLEDKLRTIPEEIGIDPFLVTGRGQPWKFGDVKTTIKHYSKKPMVLQNIPPLSVYLVAHLIEACLFIRYYFLLFILSFLGRKPNPVPKWLGEGVHIQPSTFEYWTDVEIDDSRARKVLGYRPQWDMAQAIRHAVEGLQEAKVTDYSNPRCYF